MKLYKKLKTLICLMVIIFSIESIAQTQNYKPENWKLRVSDNGRFLQYENGKPFFWLGDTGWLLFSKLNREEADKYLTDRKEKGFNVIQVMVIHSFPAVNVYGDTAFINNDPTKPNVTSGNDPNNSFQYDFWDNVDYIIDKAAEKGIYMALIPVWGSNVKNRTVNMSNAAIYTSWLVNRYRDKPNIIWVNGGDQKNESILDVWNLIGNTIRSLDKNHLITFHPGSRTQSSTWFHNEAWLDFNMFQSAHRNYEQNPEGFGEDNWKYVEIDYNKVPIKPTLDGESAYEGMPQGLRDITQPPWVSKDVRRYAYWSVFTGACGLTYGNNSVMQMHKPTDTGSAYGAKEFWFDAINDTGAAQMIFLKKLILSQSYFDRIPDQSIIAGENGTKYNRLIATRGNNYIFVYTYNGRLMKINMGKIPGKKINAYWFNPRNSESNYIGEFVNTGVMQFDPPGEKHNGNDWVLVLKDLSMSSVHSCNEQ